MITLNLVTANLMNAEDLLVRKDLLDYPVTLEQMEFLEFQAPLDRMELLASKAPLDLLGFKDLLVRLDLVVMLVCRVYLVLRVRSVPKDLGEHRAKEEIVVNLDLPVKSDLLVPTDKWDLLVHAVHLVKTASLELKELKDPLDLLVFKVFQANPDLEVFLDPRENLVPEANRLNLTTCLLKSMLASSLNLRLSPFTL